MLLDMSSSSSTNDDSLSGRSSRIGFSDSVSYLLYWLFVFFTDLFDIY